MTCVIKPEVQESCVHPFETWSQTQGYSAVFFRDILGKIIEKGAVQRETHMRSKT